MESTNHQKSTSRVGIKGQPRPTGNPTVSPNAPSALKSSIGKFSFNFSKLESLSDTPVRGQLLGIVRPLWVKAKQSECRAVWLEQMVRQNLVVRNVQSYAESIRECFRSDEMNMKGDEKNVLLGLMKLKLKDEKIC